MKLFKTPSAFIILIILMISCSFSTTNLGYSYVKKDFKQELPTVIYPNSTNKTVFKLDTSSKSYIAIKKPTPDEIKKRDSLTRNYIASIVQPYITDLKDYNNQSLNYMLSVINKHNNNLDSLTKLRIKEGRLFESNSINRYEENYLALLESNKKNDSLKTLIKELNKGFENFTTSINKIFSYITVFSDIMTFVMIVIFISSLSLQILIFFLKKKHDLI